MSARGITVPPDDQTVRRLVIGISAEALLQQWARQEAAPAGAAVVVETEIAARRRGGVEWRHDDAVAVGVLARPAALEPDRADLGWLAAGVGAAEALDRLGGDGHRCRWPDGVDRGPAPGAAGLDVAITATSALGPGRVDHVALVVRLAPAASAGPIGAVSAALVDRLRAAARALDDPAALLDAYRNRCWLLGESVAVRLAPAGSARGRVVDIDQRGALVVESDTGFQQRIPVGSFDQAEIL